MRARDEQPSDGGHPDGSSRAVAVLREPIFSPGMVEHDSAILHATARSLATTHGVACEVVTADALEGLAASTQTRPDLILSMADGEASLEALESLERERVLVVNSAASVRATRRAALVGLARPHGPFVESVLVRTDDGATIPASILERGSSWVKRADYHALEAGDVVRVARADIIATLRSMNARGITHAVVQPHLPGEVVKFYGVDDGSEEPFFRCFTGSPAPDVAAPPPRHDERLGSLLRTIALEAARRAGLGVFGGDAVLRAGSSPELIDLNAWPSFWRCRADAALAIAALAARHLAGRRRARPVRRLVRSAVAARRKRSA